MSELEEFYNKTYKDSTKIAFNDLAQDQKEIIERSLGFWGFRFNKAMNELLHSILVALRIAKP